MRASRLPLLLKCPAPISLPHYTEQTDNNRDAIEWGHMAHRWKETGVISGGLNKRQRTAFEKAVRESGIDRTKLWPVGGQHETSLALYVGSEMKPVATAVEADALAGRPGWITGHSDFYWTMLDGELWVDDLKTSRLYPNPQPGYPGHIEALEVGDNRFPEKPSSPQLKFYALALSLHLGWTGQVVTSITHWPRLPLEARHQVPRRVFHAWFPSELSDFLEELQDLEVTRVQNDEVLTSGDPSVNLVTFPGPHCRFCPARVFCPNPADLN